MERNEGALVLGRPKNRNKQQILEIYDGEREGVETDNKSQISGINNEITLIRSSLGNVMFEIPLRQ